MSYGQPLTVYTPPLLQGQYASDLAGSGFTVSDIQTVPYVGNYSFVPQIGNAGLFSSRDGFTVDFNVELQPVETDIYGLYDWTIGSKL